MYNPNKEFFKIINSELSRSIYKFKADMENNIYKNWKDIWSILIYLYYRYDINEYNNKIILNILSSKINNRNNVNSLNDNDMIVEFVNIVIYYININNNPLIYNPNILMDIIGVIKIKYKTKNEILIPDLYDIISKKYFDFKYKLKDNIDIKNLDISSLIRYSYKNIRGVHIILNNWDYLYKDNKFWNELVINTNDEILNIISNYWNKFDRDNFFWYNLATNNNNKAIKLMIKFWKDIPKNTFFWYYLAANNNDLALEIIIENWDIITIDKYFWSQFAKNTNDKALYIIIEDLEENLIDNDKIFWYNLSQNNNINAINIIKANCKYLMKYKDILYNLTMNKHPNTLNIISNILNNIFKNSTDVILENHEQVAISILFEELAKNTSNGAMSIIIKYWDMVYKTKIFWNNLSVNDNNQAVKLLLKYVNKNFNNNLLQNKNDIIVNYIRDNINGFIKDETFWYNLLLNENDEAINMIKKNWDIIIKYPKIFEWLIRNNNEKAFNIFMEHIYYINNNISMLLPFNSNIYEIDYNNVKGKIVQVENIIQNFNKLFE